MGMCIQLVALRDTTIARLHADPPLVWRVIAPDDPEAFAQARAEHPAPQTKPPSLLARWFGGRSAPAEAEFELPDDEGFSCDVDKAWQGIHYLLTRTAAGGEPPWNFLLLGGSDVGEIEACLGPARTFRAAEVRVVRDAVQSLGDAELRARFAPDDMMAQEVYPEIWDRPVEEDSLGYLLEHFAVMRRFLERTVQRGFGMLVYMT